MQSGTIDGVNLADYNTRIIPADADELAADDLRGKLRGRGWLPEPRASVAGMPGAEVWIKMRPEAVARIAAEHKAKRKPARKPARKRSSAKGSSAKGKGKRKTSSKASD